MEITGTIKAIYPITNGVSQSGKEWQKVDFIVSEDREYGDSIVISSFNERIPLLVPFKAGDKVVVKFDARAVEFTRNDGSKALFNRINLYKIDSIAAQLQQFPQQPLQQQPIPQITAQQTPIQQSVFGNDEHKDDLPF